MLIAMLTVFLLGGGLMGGSMLAPADVDLIGERVESVIEDPARTAEVTQVLDTIRTDVEDFNQVFIDSGDTLRDLYLDHEADSRQVLQTLEALNLEWYASQSRNIKLRERLKESITAEEWAAVFDQQ